MNYAMVEGGRKMKSIEKRKQALISQIQQLRREIDNLKWPEYRESQLRTCTGRSGYVGLDGFDCKR